MSITVSLRICCIAAMAPALTDTTGQARLQLPASPPSIVSDTPTPGVNGGVISNIRKTTINGIGITSGKTKGSVTSDLSKTPRGLLKPIQGNGNGRAHSLYAFETASAKVQQSLKELGLPANLPEILKQIAVSKPALHNGDHQYQKAVEKKMNQPSNGNGPNGTGKKFIRQSSLLEEKTLNGHSNKQTQELTIPKKQPYSRTIIPDNSQLVCKITKPAEMCRTSDSSVTAGTSLMSANPATTSRNGQSSGLQNTSSFLLAQPKEVSIKPPLAIAAEPKPVDLVKDASRKEFLLERRSLFLMRRLRRLQGKQLECQVKSQLKSFVDFQHQNLQTVASKAIRPFDGLQNSLFNSNDVKNLSTSNLVSLVRKLQSNQPKLTLEKRAAQKKVDEGRGVLIMDQVVSAESDRKSGHLRTNVRHWNNAVDSDATESSSGGESCEEWEDCPVMNDKQVPTPLYKRAEWKWSVDRAAIVSRWTWLQAQVSDLEYRIRQQSEIHKTIRTSKGVVTLGDTPTVVGRTGDAGIFGYDKRQELSPANVTTLMINVNKQASKLTQSLGNCISPLQTPGSVNKNEILSKSLNGFKDNSHLNLTSTSLASNLQLGSRLSCSTPVNLGPSGDSPSSAYVSPDLNLPLDATCVAARCRPVRLYRKRKLLYTVGLHQINHKAARLSSVKCQCYPPVMSCPMCGGRYNNIQHLDAEGMPIMEKVSLLDPAFHPVLSFPQEIGLPLHFEALLKSGEWQTAKPQPKVTLRAIAAEKRRQKILTAQLKEQARKNRNKKLTKTAAAVLLTSAKLRSKYDGKSPHNTPKKKVTAETRLRRKELKRRRAAQLAVAALKKNGGMEDMDQDSLSGMSHPPTPSLLDGKESASRKKRFENAYDINNIVIPYSMAASTRVEKLQYKEIQTPKWRELSSESSKATEEEPMELEEPVEEEILTDEAFIIRHEASETEERKRFRSYVTYPPVRRSRLSRESESNLLDLLPDCSDTIIHQGSSQDLQSSIPYSLFKEDGRRRSGSTSRRSSSMDEYGRDHLHDSFELYRPVVEPWNVREFPLSEEYYQEIKYEQLSSEDVTRTYTRARAIKVEEDMEFVSPDCDRSESPMAPPSPSHSIESVSTVDDVNDPEWNEARGDRRSSVSMKQAKR